MNDFIEINVKARAGSTDTWDVEAITEDGAIEQAIFAGPNAEVRAHSYADHQYGNVLGAPK
jgi:hypothetical protein